MTNAQWALVFETLTPVVYLATIALLVTILIQAKAVLVPVALAILLTFVLTPLVEALERRRCPRLMAVILVVWLALSVIGAFGYVLTNQFNDLAMKLPHYSTSIREKFATLRASGKGVIANIEKTVEQVNRELDKQEQKQQQTESPTADSKKDDLNKNVQPVEIVSKKFTNVGQLREILEPIFAPLATAGFVLVLVILMLMQREDLRNRFIRLVGQGRLPLATSMLDEAGRRISRFLLTLCVINTAFGTIIAVALWEIGIPYAALWGVTAALLRFVPYLGSSMALLLPTALAFILFEGWWHMIATLSLFLVLDMLTAYAVEPFIIGHNTGISSLALLLMAFFWTWLWGPVGLLLSTPLTVCLLVLSKHAPQLEFLGVLLGDEPALEPEVSFYQRLLAGDEEEANKIIEQNLQHLSPEEVFDEVIVPALLLTAADRARKEISDTAQNFVLRKICEIVQRLGEAGANTEKPSSMREGLAHKPPARILGIPARSEGAQIALDMLCSLLDPSTYHVQRLSTAALASEVLAIVEQTQPDLICITALPPGDLAHVRYLCKRLREHFPQERILVVCPGLAKESEFDRHTIVHRLTENGAHMVASSTAEARTQIHQQLFPVLMQSSETKPILSSAKK